MNVLICTDSWEPQINGVVTTLQSTVKHLDCNVEVVYPKLFKTIKCPFYPEISLAKGIKDEFIERYINDINAIHIATEGPVGLAFRNYCAKHNIPFTTAYHTELPHTIKRIAKIPEWITYKYLRWFHKPSKKIMVSTQTLANKLKKYNFKNEMVIWGRAVDTELFRPIENNPTKIPTAIYVGRVSKEKNLDAFLKTKNQIRKIVVGNGPDKERLQAKYPDAMFTGYHVGESLVRAYASADVFVFPSKCETFGLVMLEALACGVPVAAYPVPGPIDVITKPELGCLSDDLEYAIDQALLKGDPHKCRQHAKKYSWEYCTKQFFNHLVRLQ